MAIVFNGEALARIFIGSVPVQCIWLCTEKIYSAVRSCFGGGRWRSEKPWIDNDKWITK